MARTNAVSDQAFAHGVRDGLGAAAGVELGDDVVQDVLDGALGVAELQRDLARRMALARSAPAPAARGRSGGRARARPFGPSAVTPRTRLPSRSGVDDAGAAGGGRDRGGERLRGQRVLAQEADGARLQRAEHRVLARARRCRRSRARRSPRVTAPMKSAPPSTDVVEDHEFGLEQIRVLPRLAHRFRRRRPTRPRAAARGRQRAPAGRSCGDRERRASR